MIMISNMTQPLGATIREVLLAEIAANDPTGKYGMQNLQQGTVLNETARKLRAKKLNTPDLEQALLMQWNELFRTGLLGWGLNLANPNPPFFHLTERGHKALANVTRDPSNPAGYIQHLSTIATIDPIARSYLFEGLECYVSGLFKASAVMVGCAAESVILCLRDSTIAKLNSLSKPIPVKLNNWRIKTVSDTLRDFFDGYAGAGGFDRQLKESFEAYWAAFAQQIRAVRNDAGHPTSVDPVTPDTVHASLLIFPELARLASSLSEWVNSDLK